MNTKAKKNKIKPSKISCTNNNKKIYLYIFLIFMLALFFRFLAFNKVFIGDNVLFQGYDELYHMRLITYSAHNFPHFLWFDSYIDYPYGFYVGWMPLFDLAIAFIIRLIAFGSPTTHTIETIAAMFPPVLGALTVFPVFLIGKELRDIKLGLLSAFLFAIIPAHVEISRLGSTDHHVAEVFLFAMILLLLMLSIKRSEKIKGIFSMDVYSLIFAVLAGIFVGVLVFTWSAAPIYIAIFSIYFIIQCGVNLYRKTSSNAIILIGTITGCTALFIAFILYLSDLIPLYQVVGCFVFLFSVILVGILSNAMLRYKIHWLIYPVAILSLTLVMYWVIDLFPQQLGLLEGALGFLARENIVGTISEAQPFAKDFSNFWFSLYLSNQFGSTLVFALIGFLYYLVSNLYSKFSPEKLLFLISAIPVIILTLQQIRFSYLSSIFLAIFAACFIYKLIFNETFGYNTSTIVSFIILMLIIAVPTALTAYDIANETPVISGDWWESLLWIRNNTPATSFYNDPMEKPEYSIMAWWDYGNWIEYVAHRPVVANNFQAGVSTAAQYFVADTEKIANDILDQRKVRYVIVDNETGYGYKDFISGKYESVLQIANENKSNYYYNLDIPTPNPVSFKLLNNNYYNTVYARLYLLDGSSIENPLKSQADALLHYRLVYESNTTSLDNKNIKEIKIFEYVTGATIKGVAPSNTSIYISVPLGTNTNRTFNYISKAVSDANGNFSLVIPYATEGTPYETKPTNNYTLLIDGIVVKNFSISNQQILNGSSVYLGDIGGLSKQSSIIRQISDKPDKMDIIWKYDVGEKIYDIVMKNNLIYVSTDNGLYAININESSLAWKKELPTTPKSIDITEDTLYAATHQSSFTQLYVINIKTDKISVIGVPYASKAVSPILVDGNNIYIGTSNIINAIDLSSNILIWKFTADDAIFSKPVIKDNIIYFASFNGTVYALDKKDGTLKWTKEMNAKIGSSLTFQDNIIYFGDRRGNITALDAATGESLWKYETGYLVDSTPIFSNNTLYASSYDGKVYALNASNGELVWKSEQLFPIYASPISEKESIFVGAFDGTLYKLNKVDGKVTGICATNGTLTASPIILDGVVYVGSQDGILYACKS
jgi:dolichyl-diphosphooligosaccharide--protein glycosyltransferase